MTSVEALLSSSFHTEDVAGGTCRGAVVKPVARPDAVNPSIELNHPVFVDDLSMQSQATSAARAPKGLISVERGK